MNFKMLRNYQRKTIDYISQDKNKRLCVQLATGGGKTHIFTNLINENQDKKILILVNRIELLYQAKNTLIRNFGIVPKVNEYVHGSNVFLGMIETVHRRKKLLDEYVKNIDILIIDECHIMNFSKILELKWKKIIGFTATPYLSRKNDCLKNYYHNLHESADIIDLIKDGFLVSPKTYAPVNRIDKSKIKKNSFGEYDEKSMTDFFMQTKVFSDCIDSIKKYRDGRTLIFSSSVLHSEKLCEALMQEGFEHVYHLDGSTPDNQRKNILENLRQYEDAILCNVNVLTFGFDEPRIKTIVINRLTTSLNLYLQMVGRGTRPFKDKEDFVLLDLYGNCEIHDLWEVPRDWQYLFSEINKSKDGLAPVRVCPECSSAVSIQKEECPVCKYKFEKKKAIEPKKSELELVKSKVLENLEKKIKIVEDKKYNPFYALRKNAEYIVKKENRDELINVASDKFCEKYKNTSPNYAKKYLEKVIKELEVLI